MKRKLTIALTLLASLGAAPVRALTYQTTMKPKLWRMSERVRYGFNGGPTDVKAGLHYGLFSLRSTRWDENRPRAESDTKLSLEIRQLAADGSAWELELTYQNPAFRSMLVSKRDFLKVRIPARAWHCDGQSLVASEARFSGDIASIIASFREFRPSDFYTCNFLLEHEKTVLSDLAAEGWELFRLEDEKYFVLTTFGTGELGLALPQRLRSQPGKYEELPTYPLFHFPVPKAAASAEARAKAREKAVRATERFAQSLKGHARTILELALSEASAEAIARAAEDSVATRQPELVKALGEINEVFPSLNFLDQINVTYSINTVYEAVRKAELDKLRLFERRARMDLGDTLIKRYE